MHEPMARLQNWTISSLKDFRKHLEVWLLEEKRFKDKCRSLIDARPRI